MMNTRLRILPVLCLLIASVGGAEPVPPGETFAALGAPDDPKVEISWNHFHDVKGLGRILKALNEAYPSLTRLVEVGQSFEGRDILALEVTDYSVGDAKTKPAIYIDANIHGNEVQGGEVVLYTAWYLCEMFDSVARIRDLLADKAFYLIPTINPDGRDHWLHEANSPHSNRGGRVPVDNDGDGLFDEDGPEDMNGDGFISRMRIKDPWGNYDLDPEYPELLMVRVDRDKRGSYRMLGWEGIDNDGDGEINEDGPGGYDPNRNWPWTWQPEGVQYGARDYPFSLPSTRAISEYVLARPNLAACQSFHNSGGMILRGPGQDTGVVEPEDERVAQFIGEKGEAMLPGYHSWQVAKDLYTVWGGEFEWFYGGLGMISFTNELFTDLNLFRRELAEGNEGKREEASFLRYMLQDQDVSEWKEVDHPDYGKVEIGGVSSRFGRVPPSFLLEEELHRNMMFTIYHAESMPLVRIGDVDVKAMGNDVFRVRVAVENHGMIPTRIQQDRKHGITPKNVISFSGGEKVIAGGRVENALMNRVAWQAHRPERVLLDSVPGLDRVYVDFLVKGRGTGTITVEAVRGGVRSQTVSVR